MTKPEAEKLGWTFEGRGDDITVEKGMLIFMGSLDLVLLMIQKVTK